MKKILVVDDDPILGMMIKDMLEWKGFEIVLLKQPKETVQTAIDKEIDLIILDKLISGTDGTEVCEWIRNNEETATLPILMMTALHSAKKACLEAGATGFIPKPFEMDNFIAKIEKLIAQGKHQVKA
tara:strand:+ start:878 stop:1258 length:381 start_codon:yes stop_codon:yes gene_type:complete